MSCKERENNKRKKEKMGATTSQEDGAKESVGMNHPHNWQATRTESNQPIGALSEDSLCEGVLRNENEKCWLDKDARNCFMLFARGLAIQRSDEEERWQWEFMKDIGDKEIEVARMLDVGWLEVSGKFNTSKLSPGVLYEVAFEVKMEEVCYGWNAPVTLKLAGPDGVTQEREEKLEDQPKEQWIKLVAGDLKPSERSEEVEFSLAEYQSGGRKKGLVIKGVTIQPKM